MDGLSRGTQVEVKLKESASQMLVMGLILHYPGELQQVQEVQEPGVNPINCDGVD